MIKSAAIKSCNKIYTGYNHGSIMDWNEIEDYPDHEEGFITDENIFLNREDALIHAKKCNQLKQGYENTNSLKSYMINYQ
jgi:hypothetical protein